jgi:hypothetical protein
MPNAGRAVNDVRPKIGGPQSRIVTGRRICCLPVRHKALCHFPLVRGVVSLISRETLNSAALLHGSKS